MSHRDASKALYIDCFPSLAAAVEFEASVLSIGSEYLPAFARTVRDGGAATAEYWDWLLSQRFEQIQDRAFAEEDKAHGLSGMWLDDKVRK